MRRRRREQERKRRSKGITIDVFSTPNLLQHLHTPCFIHDIHSYLSFAFPSSLQQFLAHFFQHSFSLPSPPLFFFSSTLLYSSPSSLTVDTDAAVPQFVYPFSTFFAFLSPIFPFSSSSSTFLPSTPPYTLYLFLPSVLT